MMLGLRGFPGVQGGVETHAEHLCPRLVALGCELTVLARSPYQPKEIGATWNGVRFVSLWAPKSKGMEAILHSLVGVLYAAIKRPDILHIQAIGPAVMTLLARMVGLRVVVTHHGPDYDRQKWGGFARFVLRLGEALGMRFSSAHIVISEVIRQLVRTRHGKDSHLIPNGVVLPQIPDSAKTLDSFGLASGKYVLLVSRLVREKRHVDLLEAFRLAALEGWKLVLVGGADHADAYARELQAIAVNQPDVVMTGFQKGDALRELYAHAGIFVLPSSHEGLPIALLEALSYGLPVIASDIPANLEVGLAEDSYFALGDVAALAGRLRDFSARDELAESRRLRREWVGARYDWDVIAANTLNVYRQVAQK
jgi:glycosyltransferase involved in cell wall biosynthesis